MTKKSEDSGDKWANVGIICAILSIFLMPAIFALGGIICGCIAMYKGKVGKGLAAVILSIILGFIGFIIALYFTLSGGVI